MSFFKSKKATTVYPSAVVGIVVDGTTASAAVTYQGSVERVYENTSDTAASAVANVLSILRPGDSIRAVWVSPSIQATSMEVTADLLSKNRFVTAAAAKFSHDVSLGLLTSFSNKYVTAAVVAHPSRAKAGTLVTGLATRVPENDAKTVLSWFANATGSVELVSPYIGLSGVTGPVLWVGLTGSYLCLNVDGYPVAATVLPAESIWEAADRMGPGGRDRFLAAWAGSRTDPVAAASVNRLVNTWTQAIADQLATWSRSGWRTGTVIHLTGPFVNSSIFSDKLTNAGLQSSLLSIKISGLPQGQSSGLAALVALQYDTFGSSCVIMRKG